MQTWKNASQGDLRLFNKISVLLSSHPQLINFLFDKKEARLSASPDVLLNQAQGLSSGEQVLLKLSIDLWCGQGGCLVSELFDFEHFIMPKLLRALYGHITGH